MYKSVIRLPPGCSAVSFLPSLWAGHGSDSLTGHMITKEGILSIKMMVGVILLQNVKDQVHKVPHN